MSLSKINQKVYPQSTIVNQSEHKKFKRVFKIPDIHTLFPSERNPLDSDPRVAEWVQRVFDYSAMDAKKFAKIRVITIFATYFYPFCADDKRFENLIKVFLLFFVLDDHTECDWGDVARNSVKAAIIWQQAISALDKIAQPELDIPMNHWKPYTVYWYIILKEMCRELNAVSKARLLDAMKGYCEGNIAESEKMETGYEFKDLEEMLKIRRHSIACYCVYALIEYSDDISLTEEEWNGKLFQHFLLMATDAIIYNNDIVSFEKEWREQSERLERMYNVVARTKIMDKSKIEDAMKKIGDISMDYEVKALEAMNELKKTTLSESMKKFLKTVEYQIGGHFQVGRILDRYNIIYESDDIKDKDLADNNSAVNEERHDSEQNSGKDSEAETQTVF